MGVANEILDFYDDGQREQLSKIAMPAKAGQLQLDVLEADDRRRLNDSDFGLVILTKQANVVRKFPVSDAGNAYLSAQYFHLNHEKLAFPARFIAARHIKTACDAYKVPTSAAVEAYASRAEDEDCENNVFVEGSEERWMLRKMATRELMMKEAEANAVDALLHMPDEHFALVLKTGDGAVIRKYAMPDAEHVKVAAIYFDTYGEHLEPEHRHRFATSVLARAEELDVDVSNVESLQKWAGAAWNPDVYAHFEYRKSLLGDDDHGRKARGILSKLAASLGETTPVEAARALEEFDRSTGLAKYYDRGLTHPYAATFGKVADGWSADVEGVTVTGPAIQKLAEQGKIARYFGKGVENELAKNPVEVFEALPDPEKSVIAQMVSGAL